MALLRSTATFLGLSLLTTAAFADTSEGVALLEAGDVTGAASAFAQAFDARDGEGAFYLGRLFELGLGTEIDDTRAANLYAAAAELGSARAQLRLGLIYHEGRVLLRDYVEGTRLICLAADTGNADAQMNCGLAQQAGRGVAIDTTKATAYLTQAADQGNVAALNVLGQTALTAGDTDAAAAHFQEAAEAGNAVGMLAYAQRLEAGAPPEGTSDFIGAYAWSSLATVRGLGTAGAYRDALEARMSSDDVLAAQAQARTWTQAQIDRSQVVGGQ
jgi:TPR repeat protein